MGEKVESLVTCESSTQRRVAMNQLSSYSFVVNRGKCRGAIYRNMR